jgi:hypothetical protein
MLSRRSFRLAVVIGGATVAAAIATSVVFAAELITQAPRPAIASAHAVAQKAPPAAKVARELTKLSAVVDSGRIGQVSCLEGDPGSYVCSYVRAGSDSAVCAVAMLKWTPLDMSRAYTVQSSGRVSLSAAECGPVKKVLHVLGTSG